MLTGPPGVGKTMLAQRLPGLLPDLYCEPEAPEATAIPRSPVCCPEHMPLIIPSAVLSLRTIPRASRR